jgi:hypothetical protein
MMDRRKFVQSSVGLAALQAAGANATMAWAPVLVAQDLRWMADAIVLVDPLLPESVAFGRTCAEMGSKVVVLERDLDVLETDLGRTWHASILPLQRESRRPILGLLRDVDRFVLQTLAADIGLIATFHGTHDARQSARLQHRLVGSQALLESGSGFTASGEASWPRSLALSLGAPEALRSDGSLTQACEVCAPHGLTRSSAFLTSVVLAPKSVGLG